MPLPTETRPQARPEWLAAAEALLFAAGDPLPPESLSEALGLSKAELASLITALDERFGRPDSGLGLTHINGKLQLSTKPAYLPLIERVLTPLRKQSLTQAALETLCVVAYRQPVTRMEVEAVRGVQCDRTLAGLVAYGLIQEVGRKETVGHPILYGTTEEFLRHFHLSSLEDLPTSGAETPPADEAI